MCGVMFGDGPSRPGWPGTCFTRDLMRVASHIEGALLSAVLVLSAPAAGRELLTRPDSELRAQVEEALRSDQGLTGASVRVLSVREGVVFLAGRTKTTTDDVRAMGDAARVPGVVRIVSEIRSGDVESLARPADENVARAKEPAEIDRHYGAVDATRDAWITSATKLRLLADNRTPGRNIDVDTHEGEVKLFGMVPSAEARAAAEEDARKVSGVKHVANRLEVVPPARQDAVKAHDEGVERGVRKALEEPPELKDARIDVEVRNGAARLAGTVQTEEQRIAAARAARATPGVRSVEDDLRIGPKPAEDGLRAGSRPWPRTAEPPWLGQEETKQ
jgi:osmotically-inducible protein OsmY